MLSNSTDALKLVNPFGRRPITHVFHDIDGTHSLIREWVPVMSLTLHTVVENGLPPHYDSAGNVARLVKLSGEKTYEETDRFCVESAGLSALTQMEWAIRRAIEEGVIPPEQLKTTPSDLDMNKEIIRRIWAGEERFDDLDESSELTRFLEDHAPRLFQMYESILNGACRDANLAIALKMPETFRVEGSLDFMEHLHKLGAINYFITGAVIYHDEQGEPQGGMYEEVCALGFNIGSGQTVESVHGSTWDKKMPKDEVMKALCREENIDPANVLIIGDGRSEISAGVEMGAVTISRLPLDATRQRELHRELGTNLILPDYSSPATYDMFFREPKNITK